jgi:DNA-binding response OmpR family regulator
MTGDLVYLEDAAGRQFPLEQAVTVLGRSANCDLFIPDKRASRRHAEIRKDDDFYRLHDLQSVNGTFLNKQRIFAPEMLRDGDEIAVASAILIFHDPESTLRATEFPLLVVDQISGEIWVDRQPIALSPKEKALFDLLFDRAGQVLSKQEIAAVVWPEYRAPVHDYQIESLVKRLREKLEPDPRDPVLVLTVRGHGYKLVTDG